MNARRTTDMWDCELLHEVAARPSSGNSHGLAVLPLCVWIAVAVLVFADAVVAQVDPPRAIRRSDVVFMYDNPEMYEPYGCTVLGWAGRADREHIARAHEKGLRLFSVSVGFRTEFRGMIDFSEDFLDAACRTFADEPFIVPWLWDHKHKGEPAWHFCTNSPLFREFLYSRLQRRMAQEPDGLHIDDYEGTAGMVTWQQACFCRHCMAGFREYLKENLSAEDRAALEIGDLDGFDYRQFLLDLGVTADDYNRRRASLPLSGEFLDYQIKAVHQFVAEYRRRGAELRGKSITLSVNSPLSPAQRLVIAPHLSYFCCEIGHAAASRQSPTHPIYIYKLADAVDRPVTATASGHDWAYVSEHNLTGLIRHWAALSYAHGHMLMAPHRQWCYTKEKGTHWANFPAEDLAWVYRFVRQSERLFDCYEAVAPVGVVYDMAARREGRGDIRPIAVALAERNMPFTIVMAGDDWLPDYRLTTDKLARFRAVVVPEDLAMAPEQKALIDAVAAEGRLVTWPNDEKLAALLPPPIVVEGSEHVAVVPRAVPDDPAAPVVVHLVNRRYDRENDAMVPQRDFTVRLRADLFSGRTFTRATMHAPREEPSPVALRNDDGYIELSVPQLDLWGLVALGVAE